ncbi:MAG: hypothetical protein ACHQ6U_03020 [Thermodesulfobacteriota bacterium]
MDIFEFSSLVFLGAATGFGGGVAPLLALDFGMDMRCTKGHPYFHEPPYCHPSSAEGRRFKPRLALFQLRFIYI